MDLSQLPNLTPLGVGGCLVLVILYLLRANHVDRTQHRDLVEALTKVHKDTVASLTKAHKEETDGLDERIAKLEKRADDLDDEVDKERDMRREADDRAAAADRRAAAAEATAAILKSLLEGRAPGADPATSTFRYRDLGYGSDTPGD